MSKNKIRRPKKATPALAPAQRGPELGNDAGSLVAEFKQGDAKLAQVNQIIESSNEQIRKLQAQIQNAQKQGQIILGSMDVLTRMLNRMGIDPNNYEPPQEVTDEEIEGEEPDFSEEIEENVAEVVDFKRDARLRAIRKRLSE